MSRLTARLDRRLVAGALVLGASAVLLAAGLFSIIVALGDDPADLPGEGSIHEIIADTGAQSNAPGGEGQAPDVAALPPVRFSVPRLYIDAPVVALGLDEDRNPIVPDRPDQVAWYDFSAAPGAASNAVFSGHVDWRTREGDPIPGVFYRLRELEIGDTISVTLADGAQATYRVTGNVAVPYDDPNVVKAMGATSRDVMTVITCGGTWQKDWRARYGGNYSHRVIVRAERVPDLAEGNVTGGES
jgi:LPXTG-site transpeptidase (sortase) family protein